MVQLLEMVNRPKTLGYQADMAHNLLFTMGYNAPEDRILPEGFDWTDREQIDAAYRQVAERVAPMDDRLPRRAERRDGEGFGLARQDRPPLSSQ